MIHNHEVPGSIPGLATEEERGLREIVSLFLSAQHRRAIRINFFRKKIRIFWELIEFSYICGRLSEVEEGAGSPLLLFLTDMCMIEKKVISQFIEEKLASSSNYLVDVVIKPGNLIVVEIDSDEAVSIDDCAELSRYLEEHLDRDVEDYELEVGSAGITSPFKVLRQYVKNIGNEVEMLLKNGSKLTGVLKSADENGVVVSVEKKVKPEGAKRKVTVTADQSYIFDEIKYTKYVIRFK